MTKLTLNRVKMTATNGGSIKNYDSVELTDVDMNFSNNNIDIHIDENVAILKNIIDSGHQEELVQLILALKSAEPKKQEAVIKNSKISNLFTKVKDYTSLIKSLFGLGEQLSKF